MTKKWEALFNWMHSIRLEKKRNTLHQERVAELDQLEFDWNIPGATLLDISGLLGEKIFAKKFGSTHSINSSLKNFENEVLKITNNVI